MIINQNHCENLMIGTNGGKISHLERPGGNFDFFQIVPFTFRNPLGWFSSIRGILGASGFLARGSKFYHQNAW